MKLFLEQEEDSSELDVDSKPIKTIVKVKEVPSLAVAVKDKDKTKKSYFHKCYHNDKHPRPCKREAI